MNDMLFQHPIVDSVFTLFTFILFTYPILGSFKWFIGVLSYRFLYKYRDPKFKEIATEDEPFISIMVPAHNEEVLIEHTIRYLMNDLNYSNYEVLVMDDGSTDATPQILEGLAEEYDNLRVIHIEKNKGKAHAFNIGIAFAKGDYILSNDADTIPEPDALWKYMNYFNDENGKNIGAVTANMDVQNRSRIIEKSQTVEFSSIVGVIKRSQSATIGTMYAYSGANTMYRKAALIDVGLFRQDRATEDISIAWDHQFNGWTPVFAPDILFYMNVPSTLKMLYRQRKRWAKGGTEVWLTNITRVLGHPIKRFNQLLLFLDQTLSIFWTMFFWISSGIFVLGMLYFLSVGNYERVYHMISMAFIFVAFEMFSGILQLSAALIIDDHHHKMKYFLFSPFYMILYWQINALSILTTLIPAIKTILGFGSGTWSSPQRLASAPSTNKGTH